jgi:hypothetical protein
MDARKTSGRSGGKNGVGLSRAHALADSSRIGCLWEHFESHMSRCLDGLTCVIPGRKLNSISITSDSHPRPPHLHDPIQCCHCDNDIAAQFRSDKIPQISCNPKSRNL